MKNRRIAIIAFVLVAVMAIGIGYAATTMSDQFSINGTVTADENNDKFNDYVYFSAVTGVASNGATVDASTWIQDSTEKDSIVVTPPAGSAAFKVVEDKLTITATVVNEADIAVKLANVNVAGAASDEYFKVTVTGVANDNPIAKDGGTTTITIVIELIKTPTSLVENTFTVTFDVVPA